MRPVVRSGAVAAMVCVVVLTPPVACAAADDSSEPRSLSGQQCFDFCFGRLAQRLFGRRAVATHVFRAMFLGCVVVGASSSVDAVLKYSDVIIFGLAFTNTLGLFILSSEVRRDMVSYFRRRADGQLYTPADSG